MTVSATQTADGNEASGKQHRTQTGTSRYDLLAEFDTVANGQGGNGRGAVDFRLFGAAYAVRQAGESVGGSGAAPSWLGEEDVATRLARALAGTAAQSKYLLGGGLAQTVTGDMRSGYATQAGYAAYGPELYGQSCFAAGTKLWTGRGRVPIEQIAVGDEVWSREENDPDGPLVLKRVEELFVRVAPLWNLHVGGDKVIRTSLEHPFYVWRKGWTGCKFVGVGDWLKTEDHRWVQVTDLCDSGEVTTVYNIRVADYHTYFVGTEDWGFTVWAHNQYWQEFRTEIQGHNASSTEASKAYQAALDGKWGAFQSALGGKGFTKDELSNAYHVARDGSDPFIIFNQTHKNSQPKPKGFGPNGGPLESHHGLQQAWAKANLASLGANAPYSGGKAPTVTLEKGAAIPGVSGELPHATINNAQNERQAAREAVIV